MGRLFSGPHGIDDLRVIMSIVDYLRPDLYRWPSYEFLAFVAGMSEAKLKERIQAMQAIGWLVAKEKGSDGQVEFDIQGLIEAIARLTDDEAESSLD